MNCNEMSGKTTSCRKTDTPFFLRQTTEKDLPAVLEIIASARTLLMEDGVPQWQNGNPSDADFLRDVQHGWSRVLVTESDEIVATAAVVDEPDPNYRNLLQGAWIVGPSQAPLVLCGPMPHTTCRPSQGYKALHPYVTVHRFAVAPSARGTGAAHALWFRIFEEVHAQGIPEVRVDTHQKNRRMRRLVEGLGFACAGVVCIDGDRHDERLVYQAFLPSEVQEQQISHASGNTAETALPSYPMPFEEQTTPILRQRVCIPLGDGAEIAVWIYGPRVPVVPGPYGIDRSVMPLVVLHGNGEDHTMLAAQIAHVATTRPVIALDTRGHGLSTRGATRPLTYEMLAHDAFEVLNALGISRAHVYGFSDGGIEALIMARDAPGRVGSLTLAGANTTPAGLDEHFLRQERHRSLALAFGRIVSTRLERACELSRLMLREPNLSLTALSRISCPACVMAGEHDVVLPDETDRIVNALPFGEKRIVAGCGHMLPQEAPDAINQALDETMFRAEHLAQASSKGMSQQASHVVPIHPYMPAHLVAIPLELHQLPQVLALYDALLAHEQDKQDAALALIQPDVSHPRSSGDTCGWVKDCWPLPGDVEERLRAGQYRGIFEKNALLSDGTPDPSAPLLGVQALDHDMGYGFANRNDESGQVGAAPSWESLPECDVLVPHLLAAHPTAAGNGVGRALVADLISQARIRGVKAIRLNTSPENVSATTLYLNCGFKMYAPVWLPYEGLPLTGWTVPFEIRLD